VLNQDYCKWRLLTQSVIDDDEDTIRLFSQFLTENNIHVSGNGYNGKTAVKIYQENSPDCVLIDIMMPNGNGFYAIKKLEKSIPKQKLSQ